MGMIPIGRSVAGNSRFQIGGDVIHSTRGHPFLAAQPDRELHADSEDHDGECYDITGIEAFTLGEAAAELSRATGRRIAFEDEPVEDAFASRRESGEPRYIVEGWVTTYTAIAAGELETVSDCVERFLDREPQRLGDWLRANPESYRHLLHTA